MEGVRQQAAGPGGPNYFYIVPYYDELSNGKFSGKSGRRKAETGNFSREKAQRIAKKREELNGEILRPSPLPYVATF